jgi:hypothetical protein
MSALRVMEAVFAFIGIIAVARWMYEELMLERLVCVFMGHDPDFKYGGDYTRCTRCFTKVKWSVLNS